jgi:hypothetical protein
MTHYILTIVLVISLLVCIAFCVISLIDLLRIKDLLFRTRQINDEAEVIRDSLLELKKEKDKND